MAARSEQYMRSLTDQQLIERIAAKQPEALAALYDRFSKLLYGIILTVVRDSDDAEDILQEVFIQIWRSAHTYQQALGTPKTWLVRLAHNRGIDLLRSKRHKQRKSEVQTVANGDQDPAPPAGFIANTTWQDMVQQEKRVYISSALSQLPQEQRSLIDLAFLQGYTHHEIAETTGIPLGTVKTRIRAGMQGLRSQLRFFAEEIKEP
jgi:RNA polymerase sigma-70 factor (ECF subfamily)